MPPFQSPSKSPFKSIAIALACLAIASPPPAFAETTANPQKPGVAQPACAGYSQTEMNICAGQWFRTADFLRSLIYDDLNRQLPDSLQDQLAVNEQIWSRFRDRYCQQSNASYREGSIYPLLYGNCLAKATNDRIADLQALGEADLETEDAPIRLRERLATFPGNVAHQQWARYQTAHCQFEAQRFPDQPTQAEQCRDRLAARRIRQLQDLDWAQNL
jgi:uncharacterized protein YecT (DUF1311 family)